MTTVAVVAVVPSPRLQERLATVPVEVSTKVTLWPWVTLRLEAVEPLAVKLAPVPWRRLRRLPRLSRGWYRSRYRLERRSSNACLLSGPTR